MSDREDIRSVVREELVEASRRWVKSSRPCPWTDCDALAILLCANADRMKCIRCGREWTGIDEVRGRPGPPVMAQD